MRLLVNLGTLQLDQQELRIGVDILPIASIRKKIKHTNLGKQTQLVQMDRQRCGVAEGLTNNRNIEPST